MVYRRRDPAVRAGLFHLWAIAAVVDQCCADQHTVGRSNDVKQTKDLPPRNHQAIKSGPALTLTGSHEPRAETSSDDDNSILCPFRFMKPARKTGTGISRYCMLPSTRVSTSSDCKGVQCIQTTAAGRGRLAVDQLTTLQSWASSTTQQYTLPSRVGLCDFGDPQLVWRGAGRGCGRPGQRR